MSEMMEPGLWYKIRYTPIRDALHGEMSGRLDSERRIAESGLPSAVQDLIRRVSRRTRLWRLERAELVDDLVAHFQDGANEGVSTKQLLDSFGDEGVAAQLIRRAKRRNRPLAWHAVRYCGWSGAVLLMMYLGFAVYFFSGQPSPRVDYVGLINGRIEQRAITDRAWPLYRTVFIGLGEGWQKPAHRAFDSKPPAAVWQSLKETIKEHPQELEMIRQAAARPMLGFLFGTGGSAYDPELWPELKAPQLTEGGQKLSGVPLPHLQPLLNLAALLTVDATTAREERDRRRYVRDIESMIGLSDQLGRDGSMLAGVFSLVSYRATLRQLHQTLEEAPGLLSDQEWTVFAHRLSAPRTAADLVSLDFERMGFDDFVQRAYTDDGDNDGRLTPAALEFTRLPQEGDSWVPRMLDPTAGLLIASRREITREYESILARSVTNWATPLRNADWNSLVQNYGRLDSWKYFPLTILSPRYETGQANFERYLGERDGVIVRIALEIYRMKQGTYPSELADLVPALLPEIPADRITGDPVRYAFLAGKPIVYSVGVDRDDDGGRGTINAAQWTPSERATPDGDWILDGDY